MRTEPRHHDRCQGLLRLRWIPTLPILLMLSCATIASVPIAAVAATESETESELVETANSAAETAAREGEATAVEGTTADETESQASESQGSESQSSGSPAEQAESENKEQGKQPVPEPAAQQPGDTVAADAEKKSASPTDKSQPIASKGTDKAANDGDRGADSPAKPAAKSSETSAEESSAESTKASGSKQIESAGDSANGQAEPASEQQSEETPPSVESDPVIEVEPADVETQPNNDKKPDPPSQPIKTESKEKCVIGATATLLEKQSELLFRARVDSGAKSCSMHVEKMRIEDEAEKMVDNIGKVVQFQVKNGKDKAHWLESKIAGYVIIKNSQSKERRYKVPMTFRWKHMEKEVLVTLTDRNHMEYPLLLGRNFLRGHFLVDVELDSDD